MIHEDLINIFRQLLGQVQQWTWFIVNDFKLNLTYYKTLLITSGILRRRGNELVINNGALQESTERLQPDMSIHITRARILNRNVRNNLLAINEPIYRNPDLQLRYNHKIRRMDSRLSG